MTQPDTPVVPEQSAAELYEDAPCGYLCCDAAGRVLRINTTLLRWLGYGREDVVGARSFTSFLTLPGRVFHETHFAPLLHMQGYVEGIALDLACKDGTTLPALLNCKQVAHAGTYYRRFSVFNASDRRRYERELLLERRRAEQAAKAKAEFVATASHEIRNQLHSISAASQLLALNSNALQHERYLEQLGVASASLLNLVDNILDYSKMEAGKLSLDERAIDPRVVVANVVESVRARAELQGIELRSDCDERVPARVFADPIKLMQVLTNLCSNALKFTERGFIQISVRLLRQSAARVTLQFSVRDTGVGIVASDLPALCDEFTRVSKEANSGFRGSGLGLSITQRILRLYRSELHVESEPRKGSFFHFELQLTPAEPPTTMTRGEPEPKAGAGSSPRELGMRRLRP